MPFFYQSGQEIRPDDRVLIIIHGETGEMEFSADPAENPDDWGSHCPVRSGVAGVRCGRANPSRNGSLENANLRRSAR